MAKKRKLEIGDCGSLAGLFSDDLIAYHRSGGKMKNLTAKKVYDKIRNVEDGSTEFTYENVLAEIKLLKERIAALKLCDSGDDSNNNEELLDVCLDIDLSDEDNNYVMEKLGLSETEQWTDAQQQAFIGEALRLKAIREGEDISYIKIFKHGTEEEIDVSELFEEKD